MMPMVVPALLPALLWPGLAPAQVEMVLEPVTVTAPSGFDVTLEDVIYEEDPYSGDTLIVVRLVAPAIASPVLSGALQSDMEWACETWGLPASDALSTPADQIIVEMMEAVVPRGESAPETRRFFETYSPDGDLCIWRLF